MPKQTGTGNGGPRSGRDGVVLLDDIAPAGLRDQLNEIIALVESGMKRGPAVPPAARRPPANQPLGYTLADAAISSPDDVEGYARGALASGHRVADVLEWAGSRADHPTESEAAVAAITGVIRERGYDDVLAWAAEIDDGALGWAGAHAGTGCRAQNVRRAAATVSLWPRRGASVCQRLSGKQTLPRR